MNTETPQTTILADGIPVHCAHSAIVKTNELKPHPRNPNIHPKEQIQAFAKIIQTLGWRQAIVVSTRSGLITKGHGKLAVARYLEAREVPVDYQHYKDEAQEWQDIIADNKIAEMSERDEVAVAKMLEELKTAGANTSLTGYRDNEVDRMLAKLRGDKPETAPEEQEAEAILKKWGVAPGELWTCGPHRILCADSTAAASWTRLMDGARAQVVHTDPPYGVDYHDAAGTGIQGDKLKQNSLAAMVRSAMKHARTHSHDDAAFYIWHANRRDFEAALDACALVEKQYITWVKDSFVLGRNDYHWQTEHCFYAEKAGHVAKWCGDRTQGTVWRVKKLENTGEAIDLANGLHVTDGAAGSLFLRHNPPKAGKFRHLRVADQPVVIADRTGTTAWQVSRDARADYLHPCLPKGELVFTAGAWRPIEAAKCGQTTPYGTIVGTSKFPASHIVTITLEDGAKTRATGNHPFLIARDNQVLWMEARHIKSGDKTLTLRNAPNTQKPCHADQTENPPPASFQNTATADSTTHESAESEWSTSSSGKPPTAPSQKASNSTTSTETNSTIEFPISNLLTPLITSGFTVVAERTPQEIGRNHARPADSSSPRPQSTGISPADGSVDASAEPVSATGKSPLEKFELRTVGSVVHETTPTVVYNLTIEGIPAFDTAIGVSHNTQKPAQLAEIAIANSSAEGDIVVDCFGGSFSTLVAAESLKRRAFMMDLEPKWCAVGLERWHRATGLQPTRA